MSLSFNNAPINFPFQKQMKYDLRKSRNTLLNINADIKQKRTKIFSTLQSYLLQLFWSHCTCFYGNHTNHDSREIKRKKIYFLCTNLSLTCKRNLNLKWCTSNIVIIKLISIDHSMSEKVADNLVDEQYIGQNFSCHYHLINN